MIIFFYFVHSQIEVFKSEGQEITGSFQGLGSLDAPENVQENAGSFGSMLPTAPFMDVLPPSLDNGLESQNTPYESQNNPLSKVMGNRDLDKNSLDFSNLMKTSVPESIKKEEQKEPLVFGKNYQSLDIRPEHLQQNMGALMNPQHRQQSSNYQGFQNQNYQGQNSVANSMNPNEQDFLNRPQQNQGQNSGNPIENYQNSNSQNPQQITANSVNSNQKNIGNNQGSLKIQGSNQNSWNPQQNYQQGSGNQQQQLGFGDKQGNPAQIQIPNQNSWNPQNYQKNQNPQKNYQSIFGSNQGRSPNPVNQQQNQRVVNQIRPNLQQIFANFVNPNQKNIGGNPPNYQRTNQNSWNPQQQRGFGDKQGQIQVPNSNSMNQQNPQQNFQGPENVGAQLSLAENRPVNPQIQANQNFDC